MLRHPLLNLCFLYVLSILKLYITWRIAVQILFEVLPIIPFSLTTYACLLLALHFLPKYFINKPQISDVAKKAVLITGCDHGIGNALAKRFDQIGFTVFAGCLEASSSYAENLRKNSSSNLEIIQLDVTNDREVKQAKQKVGRILKEKNTELWAVINNAGIGLFGEMEWLDPDVYNQVFDVNVVGQVRVIQQFLPFLRKSKGRVVNMSSVVGIFAAPLASPYSVSKFGVEALGDTLRHELSKWEIKVILVEPGNFASKTVQFSKANMQKLMDATWNNMSEEIRDTYGQNYFKAVADALIDTEFTSCNNINVVVDVFVDAVMTVYPQSRYVPANMLWSVMTSVFMYTPRWFSGLFYQVFIWYLWTMNKPREKTNDVS